jgi:outer membrane protein OmpA-like peptidoglycan-associated protein
MRATSYSASACNSWSEFPCPRLRHQPQLVIEVAVNTDSRGSDKHNLILSQHRADSVLKYLQENGAMDQMNAKRYGKENPIADNSTKDVQLENRRVTLRIVSGS